MGRWRRRLEGIRFFEFLTEEEREEFAEASEHVSFGPGENIIEEGAEQESLFVLVSGAVEVRKGLAGRKEQAPGRDRHLTRAYGRGGGGLLGESGGVRDGKGLG